VRGSFVAIGSILGMRNSTKGGGASKALEKEEGPTEASGSRHNSVVSAHSRHNSSSYDGRRNSSFHDTHGEKIFLVRYHVLLGWAQDLLHQSEIGASKALTHRRLTEDEPTLTSAEGDGSSGTKDKWRRKSVHTARQASVKMPINKSGKVKSVERNSCGCACILS